MKRKTYEKKLRAMVTAIHAHPQTNLPEGCKVGGAYRNIYRNAHIAAVNFGSYAEAWNNKAMRWAREFYMGEVI